MRRVALSSDLEQSTAMFGRLADPKGANNPLSQVLYGLALRSVIALPFSGYFVRREQAANGRAKPAHTDRLTPPPDTAGAANPTPSSQ